MVTKHQVRQRPCLDFSVELRIIRHHYLSGHQGRHHTIIRCQMLPQTFGRRPNQLSLRRRLKIRHPVVRAVVDLVLAIVDHMPRIAESMQEHLRHGGVRRLVRPCRATVRNAELVPEDSRGSMDAGVAFVLHAPVGEVHQDLEIPLLQRTFEDGKCGGSVAEALLVELGGFNNEGNESGKCNALLYGRGVRMGYPKEWGE
ncbi:hypothetical protein FB451DRAFT_1253043 [Mycena latifolia]|nr:hypothetical protein FB451DRAFT_1253043 [Mycena latifolia]